VRISAEALPDSEGAVVEVVEMLGDATVLTVKLESEKTNENQAANSSVESGYDSHQIGDLHVIIKMEPSARWRPGERVFMSVDERRIHVFDMATGDNLIRRNAGVEN
jgi:ABC-type sugar transport system ATPase subunit